jgi:sortase (surface protein transpeptidase)
MPRSKKKSKPPVKKNVINKNSLYTRISLVLGVILVITALAIRVKLNFLDAFIQTPGQIEAAAITGNTPQQIVIPRLNLTLPVGKTLVENDTWQIYPDGASFWSTSAGLGAGGNTVLYAHNTRDRFGPIRWLEIGDVIEVTDDTGLTHAFKVVELLITKPDDLSYIKPKQATILTLYTCDGWLDQNRFIAVATPINKDQTNSNDSILQ